MNEKGEASDLIQDIGQGDEKFFLLMVDLIFASGEIALDVLIELYARDRVRRIVKIAMKDNMLKERIELNQENMSSRGRPKTKKIYSLNCCCPSPGLTQHCRQCSLGKKIISIEGDFFNGI